MTAPTASASIPGLNIAAAGAQAAGAQVNPLLSLLGISPTSQLGMALGSQGTININPVSPPPMKTLVYSPDIRVLIAHDSVQYDVSRDLVNISWRRAENSVASLVFRLANKSTSGTDPTKLRYNQLFERMDRVIVMAKRVEWVQVFSGYLDSVPHVQLYPGTVNFRASCTLKRLIHTWWDPGLPASAGIFDQAGDEVDTAIGTKQPDAGIGTMLRRLLVEVGGWSEADIHVQKFPSGYYYFMQQQLNKLSNGVDQSAKDFEKLLLGSDTTLGTGYTAGQQTGVTTGAYTAPGDFASRKLQVLQAVDNMGMGPDNTDLGLGQGIGTAATGGKDQKDSAAWSANVDLGRNVSQSAAQNDAAVHCFMTIYAESKWIMYANNADPDSLTYPHEAISTDHDSEGLYQQRMQGWGTTGQRMNTFASTQMFLQKLKNYDWRNMPRAQACQNVQGSADSTGGIYAAFEATALAEVQALRQGVQSNGQSSTGNIPALGAPIDPAKALSSVSGAVLDGSVGIPTTGGVPSVAAAQSVVGKPAVDTAGALSFAVSKIGLPYIWGGTGPAGYDCSGLTSQAYAAIGVNIGRNTTAQKGTGVQITAAQAVPGDLIFPAEYDHVVMYVGGNQIIEAPDVGQNIKYNTIYFNPATAMWRHYPPAQYGGSPVAPFNPNPTTPGQAPGTFQAGAAGGTQAVSSNEPIARNLFTYQFAAGQFSSAISAMFGGQPGTEEKAFINDEPLIQTVQAMAAAGLRNFQSAPDGSITFYYPDYFGLDGKNAVLSLEDIECKNVQIDLNDDALATHVYVSGSPNPRGASMGVLGWLMSKGVATVENEWLFRRMQLAAPVVKGQDLLTNGTELMRKFGVRPLMRDMSAIQSGPMEFLMALQLFMTKWAEQYATTIELTFMPELFPGMRLNLVGHSLQVYVTEVTHAGDFESGFTTQAVIMAPSNTLIAKLGQNLANMTMPTSSTGLTSSAAASASTGITDFLNTTSQWFYGAGS